MSQSLEQSAEIFEDTVDAIEQSEDYHTLRVTADVNGDEITFTTIPVARGGDIEPEEREPYTLELTCEGTAENFIDRTGTECLTLTAHFDRDHHCDRLGGSYATGQDENGRLEYASIDVEEVELVDEDDHTTKE